ATHTALNSQASADVNTRNSVDASADVSVPTEAHHVRLSRGLSRDTRSAHFGTLSLLLMIVDAATRPGRAPESNAGRLKWSTVTSPSLDGLTDSLIVAAISPRGKIGRAHV